MSGVLLAANDVNERLTETLSPEKVSLFGTSVMVNPSFYTALAVSAILIIAAVILRLTVVKRRSR